MDIADIVGLIAEDYGWRVGKLKTLKFSKSISVLKEGKKTRKIWFKNNELLICFTKNCDHKHEHQVSVYDHKIEETIKTWFEEFDKGFFVKLSECYVGPIV